MYAWLYKVILPYENKMRGKSSLSYAEYTKFFLGTDEYYTWLFIEGSVISRNKRFSHFICVCACVCVYTRA